MRTALQGPVRSFWLLAFLVIPAVSGCQDREGIRVLNESRPSRRLPATTPEDQQKFRTLAAMIPVDSADNESVGWWFVKYSGPAENVGRHHKEFEQFLNSVKVTSDAREPIKWTLPPGWTEDDTVRGRFVTLRFGERQGDEVAITQFGGSVLENVNRWRTQLGLEPVLPSALDSVMTVRPINGKLAIVVDFSGPKEPKAPMMPIR